MEQIVKILLLKVFTNVHPTGFWYVNFTAPGYSSFNKWDSNDTFSDSSVHIW